MEQLAELFTPIDIGPIKVKNRVVMPAMGVGFGADDNGIPTEQLIAFFVERARSEPGMIVTGASYVHPSGTTHPSFPMREIHLWDDKVIPGLRALTEAVHQYDVKFGAQINHGGMTYLPGTAVCASAIPELTSLGLDIKEATKEQLAEYVQSFGSAARRCIEAGFDFVEIHGGHGYLIETFLTPFYNRRTDEYGGSFENRIRFLMEVVREVKTVAGSQVPVGIRLNGDDFIPNGWGMDDLCRLAPILESAGIAYLNISCGTSTYGSIAQMIPPMYVEQGARTIFTEEVKKHVSIPVIAVGRIKSPAVANEIIRQGKADMVAMARAHLADPEFLQKARRGELEDIRPCLADCLGCIDNILKYAEATCMVNPRVGREYLIREIRDEKKAEARKVLVVGAGPAGLEAARRAAFAGHHVVLCESRGWIGGQVKLAASMPDRGEIGDIIPWYERQLAKYGVDIRLNTEVDESLLRKIKPDVLVAAAGSLPLVSGGGFVDGLENIESIEPMMADDLLEEEKPTGDTVLIVGGSQIGLQLVDYLFRRGKIVYLVEKQKKFATKMSQADRYYLMERLRNNDRIKLYRNVEKVEILPHDDVWMVTEKGREKLPGIETIVFAGERRPNRFLAEIAERMGIETHIIGDASGVAEEGQGTIMAAIAAGYDAGRQI